MKQLKYILFTIIISFVIVINVNASGHSIYLSASSNNVGVGNTTRVSVSCKGSSIGTCEYTLSYDSSKVKLMSGDSHNIIVTGESMTKSFTFKVINTGSSRISVKSYEILDLNTEKRVSTSISPTTITGVSGNTSSSGSKSENISYSTNNYLKSLSIDGITISPTFNKSTTKYTANVDANIEKVIIRATAADKKASISGNTTTDLSFGKNVFEVVVTSEKGTKRAYTIEINKEDKNPINVNIENKKYTVIKQKNLLIKPDNYIDKEITIDDQKIPTLYNETTGYTLVGLKDETGKISLFIYNESNSYEPYYELKFDAINFIPLNTSDSIKGYIKEEVIINDIKVNGYKLNKSYNYTIIYGMNANTGKKNWYSYEKTENSIQLFSNESNIALQEKNDKSKKLIEILGGVIILLSILVIIVAISNGKKKNKNKKKKKDIKNEIIAEKISTPNVDKTNSEIKIDDDNKNVNNDDINEKLDKKEIIDEKKINIKKKKKEKKKSDSKLLDEW